MTVLRRVRPKMEHYGISASAEGMLEWAWAEARLLASRNYWIATASPAGQPGVAPVWGVWLEGGLWFGVGSASRKARHLRANPRVIVHLESGDEVVIVEGRAEPVTEAAALARMLPVYAEKYGITPDVNDPDSLYLRVRPQIALAWREAGFPDSATRFEFA